VNQTTQCVLTLLGAITRAARLWLPAAQALRVLSTLNLPALLRTLAVAFVGAPPGSSYGCKVLGVALMQEVLAVLRAAKLMPASGKVGRWLCDDSQHAQVFQCTAPHYATLVLLCCCSTMLTIKCTVSNKPLPPLVQYHSQHYAGWPSRVAGPATHCPCYTANPGRCLYLKGWRMRC
jgi:hypothetical protein